MEIHAGRRARIPLFDGAVKALAERFREFEAFYREKGFRQEPDLRLNLPEYFAADTRFSAVEQYNLRCFSTRENALALYLTPHNGPGLVELRVSPDLKPIDSRFVSPEEDERIVSRAREPQYLY